MNEVLQQPNLGADPRYQTNKDRVAHRSELVEAITEILMTGNRDEWIKKFTGAGYMHFLYVGKARSLTSFAASVPFGPINNIRQTFEHPQAVARGIVQEVQVRAAHARFAAPLDMSPYLSIPELEI